MIGKSVSSAARSSRHQENDGQEGISYKEIDDSKIKSKKKSKRERSKSTWSFLLYGSQRSRPAQTEDSGDDFSFRQHLPPMELREEEYLLSALMANSR
jgi:hypothetical protein